MNAEPPRVSGFHAARTRQLRRAGFEGGFVWVGMHTDALELIGERAGYRRVKPEDVERLRVGYVDARPRWYRATLWLRGEKTPIRIYPLGHFGPLYAATIRELAAAVAGQRGMERVERGTSVAWALSGPLLIAIPALGAAAIALFVVTDALWWQRLVIPAVPLFLLGFLAWQAIARHLPRPAASLAELERQLPPDRDDARPYV